MAEVGLLAAKSGSSLVSSWGILTRELSKKGIQLGTEKIVELCSSLLLCTCMSWTLGSAEDIGTIGPIAGTP